MLRKNLPSGLEDNQPAVAPAREPRLLLPALDLYVLPQWEMVPGPRDGVPVVVVNMTLQTCPPCALEGPAGQLARTQPAAKGLDAKVDDEEEDDFLVAPRTGR
jgi:hypothetical protein